MNSMMLIGHTILRRACLRAPGKPLSLALDAGAARRPDQRRMHGAGRQDHSVARLQLEASPHALQDECDRSVDAVKDLLVRVAVRGIPIVWPIRPRVAGGGLL